MRDHLPPASANEPPIIVCRPAPGLRAVLSDLRPLLYTPGADAATGRPAHLRAASALFRLGAKIGIVQDDANFLALADADLRQIDALPLPPGPDGQRLFDDTRGNKEHKLDFEASVTLPAPEGEEVLVFGSGSSRRRETILRVRSTEPPEIIDARRLYAHLRAAERFAGSQLNIEGVVLFGDMVRLFQRGNGAVDQHGRPVNATVDMRAAELRDFLRDPARAALPTLCDIRRYELGEVDGIPFTFTDAIAVGERVYYLAAAEATADARYDGPVAGLALGILPDGLYTAVVDQAGRPCRGKAEGILARGPGEFRVVLDRDRPDLPAEVGLLRVTLTADQAVDAAR